MSSSIYGEVSSVPAYLDAPRGMKRTRSSEHLETTTTHESALDQPRKRGCPPRLQPESPSSRVSDALTPPASVPSQSPSIPPAPSERAAAPTTQVIMQQPRPGSSSSTPKSAKPPVLKALPTVRDHTTDQLNPEGDEYIPREFDESGEEKVSMTGEPLGGRQFKCRTFTVPHRGERLFMLATECARVLGYRDSYLLFNKNRSLCKIIANQAEKDGLIQQDILPYSYRSRQIAIVTARSMFRQFGSRIVVDGRRVRDDYWEAKARKQGFTEADAAGDKRPGATRMREQAAAVAAAASGSFNLPFFPSQSMSDMMVNPLGYLGAEVIYSNDPSMHLNNPHLLSASTVGTYDGLHMDERRRAFSHIPRPPHEPAGPAYQDRTQPTFHEDLYSHVTQTADFTRSLTQQRQPRADFLREHWMRGVVPVPVPSIPDPYHQSILSPAPPHNQHPYGTGAPQQQHMTPNQGGYLAPSGLHQQARPTEMLSQRPPNSSLATQQNQKMRPMVQPGGVGQQASVLNTAVGSAAVGPHHTPSPSTLRSQQPRMASMSADIPQQQQQPQHHNPLDVSVQVDHQQQRQNPIDGHSNQAPILPRAGSSATTTPSDQQFNAPQDMWFSPPNPSPLVQSHHVPPPLAPPPQQQQQQVSQGAPQPTQFINPAMMQQGGAPPGFRMKQPQQHVSPNGQNMPYHPQQQPQHQQHQPQQQQHDQQQQHVQAAQYATNVQTASHTPVSASSAAQPQFLSPHVLTNPSGQQPGGGWAISQPGSAHGSVGSATDHSQAWGTF